MDKRRYFVDLNPDNSVSPLPSPSSDSNSCFLRSESDLENSIKYPASSTQFPSGATHMALTTENDGRIEVDLNQPDGLGKCSKVYKAYICNTPVAAKIFEPDLESQHCASTEESALRLLEKHAGYFPSLFYSLHPNHSAFSRALIMSWVDGQTLNRYLSAFPNSKILSLCFHIAEAVAILHSLGMVHHDLKPHNILVSAAERPTIIDFGDSRTVKRGTMSPIEDGLGRGTITYMAPELLSSSTTQYNPFAADVYSFGVLLYYILNRGEKDPWSEIPPHRSVFLILAIQKGFFAGGYNDRTLIDASFDSRLIGLLDSCLALDASIRPSMEHCADVLRSLQ